MATDKPQLSYEKVLQYTTVLANAKHNLDTVIDSLQSVGVEGFDATLECLDQASAELDRVRF